MLNLHELSRIGFGCYRMVASCREHYDALVHALSLGCNIIDTSANYTNGESETLIGIALKNNQSYDPFIISKAGYIQGNNLSVIGKLNEAGLARDDLILMPDNTMYSVHPDFLKSQLDLSSRRLQRKQIDGFLLHNPEYYFNQEERYISAEKYYERIKKAFEFLEDMVTEERIRYYGISSNTFPLATDKRSTTNLRKVLAAANEVSENNHFKLIQFPFNLIETDALEPHHEGVSLVELARANDVVTFSNRPLNAKTDAGIIRLATYEDDIRQLDGDNVERIFQHCLELINKQLEVLGVSDDAMEFAVIKLLESSWMRLGSPEVVTEIFHGHFYPFLNHLYDGPIPQEEMNVYLKFQQTCYLFSRRTMTKTALTFRDEMVEKGVIGKDDQRALPVIACDKYLNAGIDHVLVGMRSIKYVESLKTLF